VYAAGVAASVLREHLEEPQSDLTVWVKVDPAQVRRTVVPLRVRAPNALGPMVLKQSQDPGLNLAEEKMALRF
jgi:hypothetical protein